jgi:hypothetical protein
LILKGSKRTGAAALALHLLNEKDNEHVELHELRGFSSDHLLGALKEIQAVSKGTVVFLGEGRRHHAIATGALDQTA